MSSFPTVADELAYDALPDTAKRMVEYRIAERLEAVAQSGFNEGWALGDNAGYQRGWDDGVKEGEKRAAAKEKSA